MNSNFHDDEIPKERSHYICLSVTLIDPAFKIGKNDHPQVFLEEYKYNVKEKKVNRYITDDLDISSADSDESDEN